MSKKPLDPKLAAILDSIRATVGGEPAPGAAAERAEAAERAMPAPLPEPRAGVRSVEEFLADMIRPQVQAWLDANLPELVQRMTADEIAKLLERK
jgi:hypothetical protein